MLFLKCWYVFTKQILHEYYDKQDYFNSVD